MVTLSLFLLTLLTSTTLPAGSLSATDQSPQSKCDSPGAHQFDFWVGEWKLNWNGGSGSNTITKEYDGCVIRENFQANPDSTSLPTELPPLRGMSISVYLPNQEMWRQTWVDNSGAYLDFVGKFSDGKMVLAREFNGKNDIPIKQRMTFYNITSDSLDWNWESAVGDDEWKLLWKIHYSRK